MTDQSAFHAKLLADHAQRQTGLRLPKSLAARVLQPGRRQVLYGPAVFENPYQTLLYSGFKARVSVASTLRAPLYRHLRLADVYHLHWDEFHAGDGSAGKPAWMAPVAAFQAAGGRLVWTVHNAQAHDDMTTEKQAAFEAGRRFLCRSADLIHVHSRAASTLIQARYGADPERIMILPHPSYAGWYCSGSYVPAQTGPARYVAFGMFRANKGLDLILEGFRGLDRGVDIAGLHIAGRGAEAAGVDPVPGRLVEVSPGFVPDDAVAPMFRRADFAVFGFSRILTSGSLMLALTFGSVPIAPDLPPVREALPDALHGFLFAPASPADLTRVLEKASCMSAAERGALRAIALDAAQACHPARISSTLEAALP